MISRLNRGKKVVGFKQTRKAVRRGSAAAVFLAEDADPVMTGALAALCREHRVSVAPVSTMRQLGALCGIAVGACAAALLKEE